MFGPPHTVGTAWTNEIREVNVFGFSVNNHVTSLQRYYYLNTRHFPVILKEKHQKISLASPDKLTNVN